MLAGAGVHGGLEAQLLELCSRLPRRALCELYRRRPQRWCTCSSSLSAARFWSSSAWYLPSACASWNAPPYTVSTPSTPCCKQDKSEHLRRQLVLLLHENVQTMTLLSLLMCSERADE